VGRGEFVRASDLVGPFEIEVLLEISTDEVRSLLSDSHFPPALIERGARREIRLWHREDVLAWRDGHDPVRESELLSDVLAASREAIEPEAEELMTAKEVAALLGWSSPSTAWDLSKKGSFPAPVRRHGRTKLWDRREVEHWGLTAPRRRRRGDHAST
jgi:predicted DNA-binding transcriptional regulator AlpA